MNARTTKTKKALQNRIDELTAAIDQVHAELRTLWSHNQRTHQWQRRRVLQARAGNLGDELRKSYDDLLGF